MIKLKNIELISLNCVYPENSVKALLYSSKEIEFSKIKLLSHYKPANLPSHIEFIKIDKQTHSSLNVFGIKELPSYMTEDYFLSIHDDGFVINPHLWTDEFLEYDYIGAPWPSLPWCSRNRVGNGGFVMKSRKFYKLEEKINLINGHNDVLVTNEYYDYFTQNGCKYAPIDVACKFSLEHEVPECVYDLTKTFGFHGKLTEQSRNYIKLLDNI
jgi:hypothetical protein